MDVEELLSYKPAAEPRRGVPEEGEEARPKRRLAGIPEGSSRSHKIPRVAPPDDDKENKEKLIDVELPEEELGDSLDETNLKKMLLAFEKKVLRNQELRIKFPDQPEKFLDSEVALHDAILELRAAAALPHLLPLVGAHLQAFLGLLGHENTDLAVAAVDLLCDMTDPDSQADDWAQELVDALLQAQVVGQLVANLERLDETVREEAEGVHNTLAIIENLAELREEISIQATQQGLMTWILKRLRAKMPFDANKLYCSEILSILLQRHDENRQTLGQVEGIDVMLQQLAYFKRKDPGSAEEREMMENLFDCLCSALLLSQNREKFLKGEGLQLMNLMLRERRDSRSGALKVLDHALCGTEGSELCQTLVDILGLRTVFPLFMKSPKRGLPRDQHEEHVVSIVASLLKNCKSTQRQRLLNKFTENDHEKVDRLMELHFKYLDKVQQVDSHLERKASNEEEEEELYLRRLEGGLFTLQLVDYIMVDICCSGPPSIKQRVLQILQLRGGSIKTIRNVLREYAGNMGDALPDPTQREAEQQRLLNFVDRF